MRFRSMGVLMLALGSALALSGCETLRNLFGPKTPPGCEVNYVKGNEWDIQGLKIPIGSAATDIVEIGKLKYTGKQAQALSEAVSAMDVGRRGLCAIIYSKGFETLSPEYRADKFDKMIAINESIVKLGQTLNKVATPEDGVKEATEQKTAAKQVIDKPSPPAGGASAPAPSIKASEPPATPPAKVGAVDDASRQDVTKLQARLDALTAEVSSLREMGTQRLTATGFETNGVALPAEQRDNLVAGVRSALARLPASRTPNLLVIGYADEQGAQAYNASIALRRAEAVAQLLRKHDFGRNFHTEVTSGGVYGRGAGAEARRVDIVVSRNGPGHLSA